MLTDTVSAAFIRGSAPLRTETGTSAISAPKAPEHDTDAWTGSYVYYGQYKNQPVKYRVLDTNTSIFGGTTMFLDCDTTLFTMAFDADNTPNEAGHKLNEWAISDIYKALAEDVNAKYLTDYASEMVEINLADAVNGISLPNGKYEQYATKDGNDLPDDGLNWPPLTPVE